MRVWSDSTRGNAKARGERGGACGVILFGGMEFIYLQIFKWSLYSFFHILLSQVEQMHFPDCFVAS